MISFKPARLGKIALVVSLGALAGCATMPTAWKSETTAVDNITGEGMYYPQVSSVETPDIRFGSMAGVGPRERQFFVDQVNLAASTPGRSFPIVAQAVGEDRETLVFVHLDTESPMTPYLARGILARMTSITRSAPAITEMGLSSEFDVYNMAAMLGFSRVLVTDGRDFAHQADLRQN